LSLGWNRISRISDANKIFKSSFVISKYVRPMKYSLSIPSYLFPLNLPDVTFNNNDVFPKQTIQIAQNGNSYKPV
jgi:hypothetical protein